MKHSLSLYIAKHTQLVPKTQELSAANQNRVLRQPIRTPFNFVSQAKLSITSLQSSANQSRPLRHPSRHYVTRELSARPEDPSRLSARVGSLRFILIHRVFKNPTTSAHTLTTHK